VKLFVIALKMPVLIEIVNQLIRAYLQMQLGPNDIVDNVSLVVTAVIVVWTGWLIAKKFGALSMSALAGIVIWFLSTVVIAGGSNLFQFTIAPTSTDSATLIGAKGLTIAFLLFSPVSAVLGLVGGYFAKKTFRTHIDG
jgi:hypothetical protein